MKKLFGFPLIQLPCQNYSVTIELRNNRRIYLASLDTSDVPPRSNESCRASPTLFSCANPYESKLSTDPRTKKVSVTSWRTLSFDAGGGSRIRTGDPMLAKHVLYQLSYTPATCSPWQSWTADLHIISVAL